MSDAAPQVGWSAASSLTADRLRRPARGIYRRAWDRFRRNRVAVAALVVVGAIACFTVGAGLVSAWVTGYNYSENHLESILAQPGESGYILGSDGNGRDILTRLAYGGRISLLVAVLATMSTLLIGGTVGLTAGYLLGPVDSILMRFADVLLSIPTLSLLILISALYRPGYVGLSIFIALVGWPGVSRLVRSEVLSIRNRDYVDSARVTGASSAWIITRHLVPNALPTMVIWASQVIPAIILVEAALSFLGLGVRPPTPSWGNMLSEAQPFYVTNWTNVFFPGFMIFLTALSVNLIGNGLRDALDPQAD